MTTLNSNQQHAYNVAQQLARFLRKSKRIYNNVTPFNNEVRVFLSNLDNISKLAGIKAKRGTSLTIHKRELKKEIARDAALVCTLATAYALTKDDSNLLYYVNHSYTDIYTTRDIVFKACLTIIENAITPYLHIDEFKDYGITPGDLSSIREKAERFHQSIGDGKWTNWESDQASRNITATLKKIKVNIKQLSRLLILFKETNPAFVQDFQQALITHQTTKARNTLEGIITDSNTRQPLKGITITIGGSTKTATTNMAGFYHLTGLKVGMQKITITTEGYTPQVIKVKIIRGKTVTQNILLNAITLSLPKAGVA